MMLHIKNEERRMRNERLLLHSALYILHSVTGGHGA